MARLKLLNTEVDNLTMKEAVEAEDAVFACSKDKVQDVRFVADELARMNRKDMF